MNTHKKGLSFSSFFFSSWFRVEGVGLRQVLPSPRIKYHLEVLIIQDLQVDDSGVYVCIVNNTVGSERLEVNLTVQSPFECQSWPCQSSCGPEQWSCLQVFSGWLASPSTRMDQEWLLVARSSKVRIYFITVAWILVQIQPFSNISCHGIYIHFKTQTNETLNFHPIIFLSTKHVIARMMIPGDFVPILDLT